jgi:capsular exopolysaccharide synthesis family protein
VDLQKSVANASHPKILEQKRFLEQERRQLAEMKAKLRPQVEERIRSDLATQIASNDAELEQNLAAMENEKLQLEKDLAEIKIEEGRTGVLSFEMQAMDTRIGQSSAIAKTIGDEIQRLQIELDNTPIRITLHRKAEVPFLRDTGRKFKMAGMAGLGLFGLFAGGIVWLEYLSRRISSVDEVANDLSLRIVGALPTMPRSVMKGTGRKKARTAYWHSVLTESIDAARTVLLRDAKVEAMNSVMICSAVGGEGKTTLSCHLATSLARAGRNVVLLDCDVRRPSVHRVFDIANAPGLCEVLRGSASLENVIQPVSLPGLSIVPAGKVNQETLQILAQDGMAAVLDQLKQQFDFVVVDSSPVLPVTDALLVAPHVDAVMFSIRRDISRISKVAAASQRLTMLGVPILGAVVIGLDDGTYSFRYPYKYGYGYRSGYHMQPQA